MSSIRMALVFAMLALLPAAAGAQPASSQAEWINDLRLGGYVIVLRHGATVPGHAGTDAMSRPNVLADRQLNEQGRAQAKSIGESLRRLKIPVGLVLTSTIQRAVDTGTLLGFGEITATPDLAESGNGDAPDAGKSRAQAFRKLLATRPPADNNVVIVTHKPNIVDALGKDWDNVREGEASVFEPDGVGGYKLIARVQAGEWSRLAQELD
jgi:broad specificity phosphatase PhoE